MMTQNIVNFIEYQIQQIFREKINKINFCTIKHVFSVNDIRKIMLTGPGIPFEILFLEDRKKSVEKTTSSVEFLSVLHKSYKDKFERDTVRKVLEMFVEELYPIKSTIRLIAKFQRTLQPDEYNKEMKSIVEDIISYYSDPLEDDNKENIPPNDDGLMSNQTVKDIHELTTKTSLRSFRNRLADANCLID
jgi:hypothetical protein